MEVGLLAHPALSRYSPSAISVASATGTRDHVVSGPEGRQKLREDSSGAPRTQGRSLVS